VSEFTLNVLKNYLRYDSETGEFWWLAKGKGRKKIHFMRPAGSKRDGYVVIGLLGKEYRAHRLAFFYLNGRWPHEIDHINGDRADNRIANLRECTRRQNMGNSSRKKNNKSGFKGVWWYAAYKKWTSSIRINGRSTFLGYFDTPEAASEAYIAAANLHFGEFAYEARS